MSNFKQAWPISCAEKNQASLRAGKTEVTGYGSNNMEYTEQYAEENDKVIHEPQVMGIDIALIPFQFQIVTSPPLQ